MIASGYRFVGSIVLSLALCAAGSRFAFSLETTLVEETAVAADEDAAIRGGAATALTQVFHTLLAQAQLPQASQDEVKSRIAQFVSAATAHVSAQSHEFAFDAIQRVDVVKAVTQGDQVRVTAKFTILVDFVKNEIAQLGPNATRPGEIWICPILGRCGHLARRARHLGQDAIMRSPRPLPASTSPPAPCGRACRVRSSAARRRARCASAS